jgi:hypothetical protein
VRIDLKDRTETYNGSVSIAFAPNESATFRLADGRWVDIFHDGTWQVWSAPGRDEAGRPAAPELSHQGDFTAPATNV